MHGNVLGDQRSPQFLCLKAILRVERAYPMPLLIIEHRQVDGTWNVIGGELARGTHVDNDWPLNGQGLQRLRYGIEKEFRAYNGGCH